MSKPVFVSSGEVLRQMLVHLEQNGPGIEIWLDSEEWERFKSQGGTFPGYVLFRLKLAI